MEFSRKLQLYCVGKPKENEACNFVDDFNKAIDL